MMPMISNSTTFVQVQPHVYIHAMHTTTLEKQFKSKCTSQKTSKIKLVAFAQSTKKQTNTTQRRIQTLTIKPLVALSATHPSQVSKFILKKFASQDLLLLLNQESSFVSTHLNLSIEPAQTLNTRTS